MSTESFTARIPYNTPGEFYVDEQCLDCDLCRDIAPTVFSRNDQDGAAYVIRQPVTEAEFEAAREAVEGCPCEAIHDDGDKHDWTKPPQAERPVWRMTPESKPTCNHCSGMHKPWWKFWR